MQKTDYAYAVARIRALEVSLLSSGVIEALISCKDEAAAIKMLADRGWGGVDTPLDADSILEYENNRIWETVRELRIDKSVFQVLLYPDAFHNLKAAIKEVCLGVKYDGIFTESDILPCERAVEIIEKKDFSLLPSYMTEAAKEAYETLLHTSDGQLCDIIIDRATLEAIYEEGKKTECDILKKYAFDTAALTDIRIALRCARTKKDAAFMRQAMCDTAEFSSESLIKAALEGVDKICEFIAGTSYSAGAEALLESDIAFEKWCDNRIIDLIKSQKYNSFTEGPVVAYVLARQNEIKTVRMILACKSSGLSDDAIRGRVREMYV